MAYFSLAKQRKVSRPPGRQPGLRPQPKHAAQTRERASPGSDKLSANGMRRGAGRVIWDVHCHFPRDWQRVDSEEPEKLLDARAEALRAAGVTRASLLCGGRLGRSYEESIELARRHEELFVPVAVVDPENHSSIRLLAKLGMKFERMVRLSADDIELKLFSIEL